MTYIEQQIKKAYKEKYLISICLNRVDWAKRLIGYVKSYVKPEGFKFEIIDEFGQRKNLRTVKFGSIKSLEVGGVYNGNLEKLNKYGFSKVKSKAKYIIIGKQNAYKKLNDLMAEKALCRFVFGSEYSIGTVIACTESEFYINNIAYDGSEDGISVFPINVLTKVIYGSNFENRISFLYNLNRNASRDRLCS